MGKGAFFSLISYCFENDANAVAFILLPTLKSIYFRLHLINAKMFSLYSYKEEDARIWAKNLTAKKKAKAKQKKLQIYIQYFK